MNSSVEKRSSNLRRGFTLIEIMVVVAVMGVILAAGVPTIYKLLHKEGFRKTVSDLIEVCTLARARAIMSGSPTQVVFYPRDRRCEISGGSATGDSGGLAQSVELDPGTSIELLDVNLTERKDDDVARVTFYPEGTCDEMILILVSDRLERREISLEVTTGFVKLESDPQKFLQ